jgi:predicted permease
MRRTWDDLRFGARLLARTPGFTAIALITLALGIGANSTLFSLADGLFLRPLPVPEPSQIVHGFQTRPDGRGESSGANPLSLADYFYYREHARSFTELAAHYDSSPLHLVIDGEPAAVTGAVVTESYFRVLRIQPALGRFFLPAEDQVRHRDAVAIVSYALWQQQLGANPQVVGRTIHVNGRAFTVVGVAPQGFHGVHNGSSALQIWIPSAMFRVGYRYCDAFERDCTIVELLGRLKPDVPIESAQAELSALAGQLEAAYPATNKGLGIVAMPARGAFPDPGAPRYVGLLLGVVAVVQLIACANVAGLLLARGMGRRKEIAVRLALGAGRRRIVRQLLTESALLALAGGALGLLVAAWVKESIVPFYAADYAGRPLHLGVEISVWVFAATALVSGLSAVLCGLAPALQASRADVLPALKDESATGSRRSRMRDGLVVAQVALSMVLLVGAGLMVRSLQAVYRGPGFDPQPVIMVRIRPSLVAYGGEKAHEFQQEVIRRLELLPAVVAASASNVVPISPLLAVEGSTTVTRGDADRSGVTSVQAAGGPVGDRFFEVLGVPLVEGREFDERDRSGPRPVLIVNQVLARQLWPQGGAAGQTVLVDGREHDIVGVVNLDLYQPITAQPRPYFYRNYWQQSAASGWTEDSRTYVRVAGDAASMMRRIRREISAIDPSVPISEDYPMTSRVRFEFRPVRMAMTMLVSFGVLALVLSAIGLYGVVAFVTSQRTREIAIRLALGADRPQVRSLVLGHGARLATLGAVLGLASAFAATRLLATLLYGVQPYDFATFLAVPLILVVVVLVASWAPARRATKVDPALTLRYE